MTKDPGFPVRGNHWQPIPWVEGEQLTVAEAAAELGWPEADVKARIGKELKARWVIRDGQVQPAILMHTFRHLRRVLAEAERKQLRKQYRTTVTDPPKKQPKKPQAGREVRHKAHLDRVAAINAKTHARGGRTEANLALVRRAVQEQRRDPDPDRAEFIWWGGALGEALKVLIEACLTLEPQVERYPELWELVDKQGGDPYQRMKNAFETLTELRHLLLDAVDAAEEFTNELRHVEEATEE